MQKSNNDSFENVKQNSIAKSQDSFSEKNPFDISNTNFFASYDSGRRLNNYDSDLLEEGAYKDINNDLFRLEYKISKLEGELKTTKAQLHAAKDIDDYFLINEIEKRYQQLQHEYDTLISVYNSKSLSAKISDSIFNIFGQNLHLETLANKFSNISKAITKKMPTNITKLLELKSSLSKLENLNKSVDELVSLNIPYGENPYKYEQLSKYIIKANSLQAKIAKTIKD